MHKIVNEHPEYQRAEREAAAARRLASEHSRRAEVKRLQHERALAQHRQAVLAALRDGTDEPTPPTPPAPTDPELTRLLADEAATSGDLTRAALGTIAPEVLPKLAARAAELQETAREAVALLRGLVAESNELRRTADAVLNVAGVRTSAGATDRLDAAGLLRLVESGTRLLPGAIGSSPTDSAQFDGEAERGHRSAPTGLRGFALRGRR